MIVLGTSLTPILVWSHSGLCLSSFYSQHLPNLRWYCSSLKELIIEEKVVSPLGTGNMDSGFLSTMHSAFLHERFRLETKHVELEGEGLINVDKVMPTKLHSLLNLLTKYQVSRRTHV